MSDQNLIEGRNCYATGAPEQRAWFERQWRIWPERADQRYTTNLSFHHGGVQAFRAEHGREPAMSRDFRSNVEWLDRFDAGADTTPLPQGDPS